MFTIKHVTPDSETLFSAKQVGSSRDMDGKTKVYGALDPVGVVEIDSGTVYVMNETGATVAKYEFSPVRA